MASLSPYPKIIPGFPIGRGSQSAEVGSGTAIPKDTGTRPQVSPLEKPNGASPALQIPLRRRNAFPLEIKEENLGAGDTEPDPELILPTGTCSSSLPGTTDPTGSQRTFGMQTTRKTWGSPFSGPRKRGSKIKTSALALPGEHFVTAIATSPSKKA